MFERYTERARRVIFFARYEASRYGSQYIEPEHLLLGLLRERSPLAQQLFDSRDSMEALRKEIESQIDIRPPLRESVEVPLSEVSKRILKSAAEEADRLSHKYIGNEHIFFAILREEECLAGRILRARGMKLSVPHEERPRQAAGEQGYEDFPALETPSECLPGIPEWQEQGIPEGYGFAQLLFNPPTGILVAEVYGTSKVFLPRRLFWRHKDGEGYKPLGTPETYCSQESAVTAINQPLLFFNSTRFTQESAHPSGNWASGNWDGLYSVDLETFTIVRCASRETLPLPPPYTDCWITDLLCLSEDGKLLYLTIGMCEMSGATRQNAAYYLAQLDLTEKSLQTISRLRAAFF